MSEKLLDSPSMWDLAPFSNRTSLKKGPCQKLPRNNNYKTVKTNDKNRRFGVVMTTLSRKILKNM